VFNGLKLPEKKVFLEGKNAYWTFEGIFDHAKVPIIAWFC
jgi:hypothetical protein